MKHWIRRPHLEGAASRQAHADLPAGTFEREMGKDGFFGPTAHFYHAHPPTEWVDVQGPLRPRAYDTTKLADHPPVPWDAPPLLANGHVQMRTWQVTAAMHDLLRNGDGDELLFVHNGSGRFFCDFGHLTYQDGDYLVIPRGTMWRIEPVEPTDLLMIEATNGSYKLPEKGMLGPQAIFDPGVLDAPRLDEAFRAQQGPGRRTVTVKRRNRLSRFTYPFNPLDAVGWKGDLSVVRLNWRDIRPVMSHRYHLPPSAHTTWVADRFVICTFVPRPFETDPGALKVPFFHNNDDYDEVIFYHRGQFFSRDNIYPGMITFHPAGFTHGPHPKALGAAFTPKAAATDEVAVMLDTRDALDASARAEAIEFEPYVDSWGGRARHPELAAE